MITFIDNVQAPKGIAFQNYARENKNTARHEEKKQKLQVQVCTTK